VNIIKAAALMALASVSVACAKSPESIAPSYVSEVGYQSWTCDQLGGESNRLSAALATASQQQTQARTNDTVGVILIGLPVSSMSGDNIAPEIARLKGETEAVRRASITKRCAGPAPASPAAPAKRAATS
jgi:hypothetical protein